MEWIVLEQVDDGGARLVALRLSDGARRVLYATEQSAPLHAALHPAGLRIAFDALSRGTAKGRRRTRIGLINLERAGVGWLRKSLDPHWRVARADFDLEGGRLALEGSYDGVPIADIYVLDLKFSGNSIRDTVIAGAGNPARLGCQQPLFIEGGNQVLFLRNTRPEGAWEVCMLELDRDGDSANLLEGRAPSVLSLTLTEGAQAVADVRLRYCEAVQQVFWVGHTRGGTRQVIRTARLGVRPHTDLGRTHLNIEELQVASGGELMAYSADGQVWLTDVETGATVALVEGGQGVSHRGLTFDEASSRLLFCTSDADGAHLRVVDLASRSAETLFPLGDVSVLGMEPFAATPEISERLDRFRSVAPLKGPAADATAIQRVSPPDEAPAPEDPTLAEEVLDADPEVITQAAIEAPEASEPPDDATVEHAIVAVPEDHTPDDSAPDDSAPDDSAPDDSAPDDSMLDDGEPTVVVDPALQLPPEEPVAEESPAEPEAPVSEEPTPQSDFVAWMRTLAPLDDPSEPLASLEALCNDHALRDVARLHLGTQRRRAEGQDAPMPLLLAIVAAGHLGLQEARGELLELCRRAQPRVDDGGLLEADEHFALASLLYVDGHTKGFGWSKVYSDYEGMLLKINEVLEGEGEGPAARMMMAFAEGYSRQIAGVLASPDPSASPTFDSKEYNKHSLAVMAAEATAAEQASGADRLADEDAQAAARLEAEQVARQEAEEAARQAAEAAALAEAEAAAAANRKAEDAARRAADEAARREAEAEAQLQADAAAWRAAEKRARAEAEKEERVWADRRKQAEAAAERVEAERRAAEEADWARRRAAAEREARMGDAERQAADEAAARARAEAAAKIEAAERAQREAEEALIAAEAAVRLRREISRQESLEPATPVQPAPSFAASPTRPQRVVSAAAVEVPSLDTGGWAADESIDLPSGSGNPSAPPIVPIAGLFAVASGLAATLLGIVKIGGLMPPLGVFWVVGGIGLFADRRWGWIAALVAFALNASYLAYLGLGPTPPWMSGGLLLFWAAASVGLGASLLHPNLQKRFGPKRRNF